MKNLFIFLSSGIIFAAGCSSSDPIPQTLPVSEISSVNTFANAPINFPEDWTGNWKGICKSIASNPQNDYGEFEMKLGVKKLEKNKLQWKIEYLSSKLNQVRNYELIPVNTEKGHYTVDEKNGIFLDTFLLSNDLMIEQFDIQGSNLTVKHKILSKNKMQVEFITFSTQPIRTSGAQPNKVNSFKFANYQDCSLSKN